MKERPHILVVCGRNKRRSRTAEDLFKKDMRCHIRSAGLSPSSDRKISENDLNWADLVMVMESRQRGRLKKLYPYLDLPPIMVLDIPDEYEYMDQELVVLLTDRMNDIIETAFL